LAALRASILSIFSLILLSVSAEVVGYSLFLSKDIISFHLGSISSALKLGISNKTPYVLYHLIFDTKPPESS